MRKAVDIDLEIAQQEIPTSAQGTYRKALSGNRPAAVKAMCLACQGWEDGARQAIRDCPSVGCPLHAVRPFQKKAGSAPEAESGDPKDADALTLYRPIKECENQASVISLSYAKSKIIEHLYSKGESQRANIIFATGIPESLWSEAIRSLLAEGEIEREGEKRNTRYRLKEST